jgi:transcriptional regulator with XRE-family HTH domain
MKYKKRELEEHNAERIRKISESLKDFRILYGYSRERLEEEFGISRSVLQRAESSSPENISLKTLFEIADLYYISPAELFSDIE